MFLLRVRRSDNFWENLLVGVVVCFVVLNCVLVDGRHISLKKLHRPRGERITEDSVTVEAVPPIPPLDSSTTLLRAGYASHLRQNLKKAFALQLLHQAQQNHNKNHSPTSDEFITRKTKKLNKSKNKKVQNSSKFRAHIPFLPFEDDETTGEQNDDDESSGADYDDNFASFDLAVTHPEEDPHFYQDRYKTENKEEGMGSDKPPYSLANSYFDNEYPLSQLQAMECATPTKSKGYCSTFRACVPSLFNANGDLETPALAELVSMSIGYCTSSVRSDLDGTNQFLKRKGHRFATVANRIICCPGVPPPPGMSAEDSSAEKFNDFLGGSDSYLEPDEDNVTLEGASPPSSPQHKIKNKPANQTIFVDLKGEFVQENPDTESEVWHSEEDLKAAMNKKPENIIPIEALIPEDKLPFYDPHTNTFSQQILDKVVTSRPTNNGQNESNNGQNLANNGQDSANKGQDSANNGQNSQENYATTLTPAPPAPPIIEPNDEFMPNDDGITGGNEVAGFSPPHDDGIMSSSSNDRPDFDGEQPTNENEDAVTTTARSPDENSTFIEIFPKPVNGVNGKFTLEKGVHVQSASAVANNIGENVVDSNKILLVRRPPTKNKPQQQNDHPEQSSQKVEIFVQNSPEENNNLQNFDDPTRTTDIYNKYHVQSESESELDEGTTTTRIVVEFTTTQNYNEIESTHASNDDSHNYANEDVGNYLADTITTPVGSQESGQNYGGNDNKTAPAGESGTDFPPPQTTTRYYPTNNNLDDGYTPTDEIDGSKEATLGYLPPHGDDDQHSELPETTPVLPGGENTSGESTTFLSSDNEGESGIYHDHGPESVTLNDNPPQNLNEHVTGNEKHQQGTQESIPSKNKISKEPVQNLNDHVTGNDPHVTTGSENGLDNHPINQLFPIDAATLSPQNGDNSVENGPISGNSVFSSEKKKPISGSEIKNTGSQEMSTGGSAEPSKEAGENLEEGNQSISNESNASSSDDDDQGVKKFEISKIPGKGPHIKNNPVKHPPPPTQEPELGGVGPGFDSSSDFQILSACATQDYYRSLEEDTYRQYPYLATIVGGSRPFCSGSLITDRHILTASHFLSNITVADVFHMRVHIGYKTAFGGQTEGPFAVRKVLKVIRHKGFSFDKLLNDVAILLLDRPVRFSEDIHPVCLSNNPHLPANGIAEAFETGWVEDPMVKTISSHHPFVDPHVQKYFSFGYNNVTWTLQQSMARVKTNDDCQSNYEFLEKSGIYITDSMICAATEDGKSCSFKGNSGAPLFIIRDGKPIQLGLVSWGIGCGHFPAVFTSTQKYLAWIEKVVQKTR